MPGAGHPFGVRGVVMLDVLFGLVELPAFDPSSATVGEDNLSPTLMSTTMVIYLVLYNDQYNTCGSLVP